MNNKRNRNLIWILLIVAGIALIAMMFNNAQTVSSYKYSEIIGMFADERVTEFRFSLGTGELVMKLSDQEEIINYTAPNVDLFLLDVRDYIQTYDENHPDARMVYTYEPRQEMPAWLSFIPSLLLIGALVVFWFYMMNQSQGGGGKVMSFGKAKVKSQPESSRKTTFADVAGADEEKDELLEIVEFLKNPTKFNDIGARIPKGVLLVGPPGTGKTLLARAVAGEAGVPFFSISGSDFVEMFVGVGASRVRDLFEQAKKEAPSIVFIDEIDAVGRQRGAGLGGGHDEREQTLNQLLVEMDGFSTNQGVIIIAATNRHDILDPALLRPGRFDRRVYVNYPDIKGREEILQVHTRNKPLAPDVDLKVIAQRTPGFTGADLENLANEAALMAARKDKKAITMEEIQEASIKVMYGPEKKSKVVTDKKKKMVSFHEAGHAVTAYYCPTQDPVHGISVIPRGPTGGVTMFLPEEDRDYGFRNELLEDIVVCLGGRTAEKLVLDDISTGASSDIESASKIARNMVMRYGFSEKLGPIVYGTNQEEVFLGRDIGHSRNYSETVASEIDAEIRDIFDGAQRKAEEILTQHIDQLHSVAQYLFVNEKMDREEFEKMMKGELEAPVVDWDKVNGGIKPDDGGQTISPRQEEQEDEGSSGYFD